MNQPSTAARQQQPDGMNGIELALARNRAFAAGGGHDGAPIAPRLRLFVIACVDPRVDPGHVLGLALGDAVVLRNVGGRVTPAVVADLVTTTRLAEKVAPPGSPLFEVAVIHHTQCAAATGDGDLPRMDADATGSGPRQQAFSDPGVTVATDVALLRAAAVSPRIRISGHVYDVASGVVKTVVPAQPPAADRS